MKALGVLIMVFLLVFASSGLQNVGASEADEAFETGQKYYKGEGVKQDYQEALKWFRKAANQGHAEAQFEVGLRYVNAEGVTKSYSD